QVTLLYRADDVRRESELAESVDVVGDRDALLAGGEQGTVYGFRQPLLRQLLGERHRLEPLVAGHGSDRTLVAEAGRRGGQQLERDRPLPGSTGMIATGLRL